MFNHVGSWVKPANNKARLGKTKKVTMNNTVIKFLWVREADINDAAPNTNIVNMRLDAIPCFIGVFEEQSEKYKAGALERCAGIMQLKPIIKGGKTISPVEQIKKQKTSIVIKNGNHPAVDDSELCTPIHLRIYQQLLGIALWIALCGRYDICYAVNVLWHLVKPPGGNT
jgi:hypothetical protein